MRTAARGFTLIELLIAMLVFSVLSVMAYGGLQSVLDVKAHTEKQVEKLVNLQTAFTFLGRDIEQTISRGVRDNFDSKLPALSGGGFASRLLELTRAGMQNPAGLPRSSLQRVAYNLKDNALARLSWQALDQGVFMEPVERVLLEDVSEMTVRFLDNALQWHDNWPVDQDPEKKDLLPRAVEIGLDVKGVGEVKRLFRVPPGQEVVKNNKPLSQQTGATAAPAAGDGG